ncbi:MAG: hypothetical protein MUC69_02155, partial [Gemmatimonadales bacterium]|nr:hypothetical protein [Gemmatimonadales bacterium]
AAPRHGAGAWMTPDRRAHAEHHAGWGALIGLVPGLVLGAWLAIRCAAADLAAGAMNGLDRRLLALPLVGALVGAGIGALLGAGAAALIGAPISAERWEAVDARTLGVAPSAIDGVPGIALSLRF